MKRKIPKNIHESVWKKYIGNSIHGKCFCCHKSISSFHFECGHVLPHSKGGSYDINNLRPICSSCNRNMSNMHMYDFINLYYPNSLHISRPFRSFLCFF